jgi:hypothetical protein
MSSNPNVQLPLQPTEDDLFGDEDDGDLFGSEDEGDAAAPAAPAPPAAATPSGPSGGVPSAPTPALANDEENLDLDDLDLFGSEAEVDEIELFGEHYDAGGVTPGGKTPGQRSGAATPSDRPPQSDMDENEIFGDITDDEDKSHEVSLIKRVCPDEGWNIVALRLPNVLHADQRAFKKENARQEMMNGFFETVNTMGKQVITLLTPENCIRWRHMKTESGEIAVDAEGRPKFESNARFVEWENGSTTLHVGSESLPLRKIPQRVSLFEENSPDVMVCHGQVKERFIATPVTVDTTTHESLKKAQYRKYEPVRRSLVITPEEQEVYTAQLKNEDEQAKKKKLKDKAKPKASAGTAITRGMDRAFLEDGAGGSPAPEGPSVLDIKRARHS